MKLEHKVALVLYERGGEWLTPFGIHRAIEQRWPPKPLFGRWGPRWRGLVGTGSLFLALAHLQNDGRITRRRIGDRYCYRLCA